jgi:hypothetical protein
MRGGGGVQLGACVGAVRGGAASGCAGFDTVYEKEMVQPLDSVYVWSCAIMRVVSSGAFEMSLSRGPVRRVRREVRLVMVDECGAPVRLMTMGRMSTSVRGQCWRMALARRVYLARIN